LEQIEFVSENLVWFLLSLLVSALVLASVSLLSSELLAVSGEALSAMFSPPRLSHLDSAKLRVDLPKTVLVSIDMTPACELRLRLFSLNLTLTTQRGFVEAVNGTFYVKSRERGR